MTAAIAPSTFSALPIVEGPAPLNLLIVDDERAVREACREAATALGYRSTGAESAEHTLRVIDTHNIDVVLLDLKLPGTGGLDVLRQLKKVRPDIEVVVVTGHGTVESAVQAMKAGAYDYMTKPFSLEELRLLLSRVASHLKLKPKTAFCARRSGRDKASAASLAGPRKWISCTGSLPRRRIAFTPC
jgi:DNA-binding NtrC family response regulator